MGIKVFMQDKRVADEAAHLEALMRGIDDGPGALFCSDYTYPGRYGKWMTGFTEAYLVFRSEGKRFEIELLQDVSGLMKTIAASMVSSSGIEGVRFSEGLISGEAIDRTSMDNEVVTEEERGNRCSIFKVLRQLIGLFESPDDHFGFHGAFGYDLAHQFEDVIQSKERSSGYPDLVLYLPKNLFIKAEGDQKGVIRNYTLHFNSDDRQKLCEYELCDIEGYCKDIEAAIGCRIAETGMHRAYGNGDYASMVERALPAFKAGDLFEVVPSYERCKAITSKPSELFQTLRSINPSPYAFLINLGGEHLVGASPEMYVRVSDDRVETCPISGTIPRGRNAIEDSEQIRKLLNSEKEESELTMCTDVDRNDKSRICKPESVRIIGRRQIEMYSHLIHTVDHVEGHLREGFDGLDAFMSHMWAVTVTGAPKKAAMQWIEDHEETPRRWYGGAVGKIASDGSVHTGLTLRTMRIVGDKAFIRVGATLLHGCDPASEEDETVLKAKALERVIEICEGYTDNKQDKEVSSDSSEVMRISGHKSTKVLFIDHEDSFVHTLAGYFRACGCDITTVRHHHAAESLLKGAYDLMVLSPGPGTPQDFQLSKHIDIAIQKEIPVFGVCLGLQGIVEHFGGRLGRLDVPYHGKRSVVKLTDEGRDSRLFKGLDDQIEVGRYHSLFASEVPDELVVTARTECGLPMAVESKNHRILAVQFHPESLMSASEGQGMRIIRNVLEVALEGKNTRRIDESDKPRVFDCTLRDGGLTNDFSFSPVHIRKHIMAMAESGVDVIELGYKSSRQSIGSDAYGPLKYCDEDELMEIMDPIHLLVKEKVDFAFMVDVGRVNREAFKDSKDSLFSISRIACYLHQVDEALVLSRVLKDLGYETFINIMAVTQHEVSLLEGPLRKIADDCSVDGVYLVDSYGAMLPETARTYAEAYAKILTGKTLGIHAHDNLQLALANTLEMRNYGFSCFDGSVAGMGRGGGNAPMELLLPILKPEAADIAPMLSLMDVYHSECPKNNRHLRTRQMLTGMYNVHPTKFLPKGMKTGKEAHEYFIREKQSVQMRSLRACEDGTTETDSDSHSNRGIERRMMG